ncbi:MAG: 2-C-methyl-D-erythritol 4-phosphate cytidylyltransferase [candidate division NC10 bacterium]|nr:2-C-methyl-D-erythritol 4-phosphate cytidylyltransferase [candidate division NC10 bacterium]
MGGRTRKPFLSLRGVPILALTLRNLMRCPHIDHFLVCVRAEDRGLGEREVLPHLPLARKIEWVEGGERRQDSVYRALSRVDPHVDLILIHDGVRPFVSSTLLDLAIRKTQIWKATVFGLPAKETVKSVDEKGFVVSTLERTSLWNIQTPQTFCKDLILDAYRSAYAQGFEGTDDASLVEREGKAVKVLLGSPENIKITSPEDLCLAEKILASWEPHGQGGPGL